MNTKILLALTTIFGVGLVGATSSVCANSAMQEKAPERVMAYGSYYIFGRTAFDDLDALEGAVRATKPDGVHLNACGENAAQALRAVTDRFRDLPLLLQVFDAAAPICDIAVARRVTQRSALVPAGIDASAVERYWGEVKP